MLMGWHLLVLFLPIQALGYLPVLPLPRRALWNMSPPVGFGRWCGGGVLDGCIQLLGGLVGGWCSPLCGSEGLLQGG